MSTIIQRSTGLNTIGSTDISRLYAKVSTLVTASKAPLKNLLL
ncbi:hypothetical protein [Vagococcus allomyrinae]|nr:hypothetical protein [Vagococcus allomyrinae]